MWKRVQPLLKKQKRRQRKKKSKGWLKMQTTWPTSCKQTSQNATHLHSKTSIFLNNSFWKNISAIDLFDLWTLIGIPCRLTFKCIKKDFSVFFSRYYFVQRVFLSSLINIQSEIIIYFIYRWTTSPNRAIKKYSRLSTRANHYPSLTTIYGDPSPKNYSQLLLKTSHLILSPW